jgi:hypothetical protein
MDTPQDGRNAFELQQRRMASDGFYGLPEQSSKTNSTKLAQSPNYKNCTVMKTTQAPWNSFNSELKYVQYSTIQYMQVSLATEWENPLSTYDMLRI